MLYSCVRRISLYRILQDQKTRISFHHIALSNCAVPSKTALSEPTPAHSNWDHAAKVSFASGELVIESKSGHLPPEERIKLRFFQLQTLLYLGLLVLWRVWCSRWSEALFSIHHYITYAVALGFAESACWCVSLSHWNYVGHRWWSMIALATCGTVIRQGLTYALVLLVCLGLGVCRPKLETKQTVCCALLVASFILTETAYQMVSIAAPGWQMNQMVGVLPGSFVATVFCVWIVQALDKTMAALENTDQSTKLEVYQNLRSLLYVGFGLTVAVQGYHTATPIEEGKWKLAWLSSDGLVRVCFFVVLSAIMFLLRPSEQSSKMVYSEQLPSGEEGIQMGKAVDSMELGRDAMEVEGSDYDFDGDAGKAKQNAAFNFMNLR